MNRSQWKSVFTAICCVAAAPLSGCGATVPQMPEVWDQSDPLGTQHMEMQIKRAVYCELHDAISIARGVHNERYFSSRTVTESDDQPLPDSWGAQITFTFTVDETSKLTPGLSLKAPLGPATSFFGDGVTVSTPRNFAFGLGGVLSSQATRIDTFDTFYTIGDIAYFYSKKNVCDFPNPNILGAPNTSSLLLVKSNLGIKEWLPQAVEVSDFLRSSRAAENGEGPALTSGSFAADSISYHIKYIVVSDANATPVVNLVRFSANTASPLIDLNRTRTHDLLITIGPSATSPKKGARKGKAVPSQSAAYSHLAQQIGSAVATSVSASLQAQ